MFLLVALLFGILYGVIIGIGIWTGAGNVYFYTILAFAFIGLKYLVGPYIVAWTMKVKWVPEKEAPELHRMLGELAGKHIFPSLRWVSHNSGYPMLSPSVERSGTGEFVLPGAF
jgi:heat shock protein HtpX